MALVDNAWYIDFGDGATTGYYSLTKWANITAVAGQIIRQFTAPAVGSERVFVCTTAGATGATEPTWTNTRGAINASSTARYQECTGIAALNGDATNTPSWTITATPPGGVKNTAVTLGQVIKRDSGASYQICTVAGTAGNGAEPAFSNTAGTTTADNTVTWTSLGVVGNFTGWQAPHARLSNAYAATWGQTGNSFYVASENVETRAAVITLASPGVAATPCLVYCVTKTALPPASANITTGASISTTGANNLSFTGTAYYTGFTFNLGSVANAANLTINNDGTDGFTSLRNCSLIIVTTGSAGILLGPTSSGVAVGVLWDNVTCTFAATGQAICVISVFFTWRNTASAIGGATFPATLFKALTGAFGATARLVGVDLSALGSNAVIGNQGPPQLFIVQDCRLGASATITTPTRPGSNEVYLIRADSSGTNYRHEKYRYEGTQTVDTTIVRTGGASDGTTTLSWKIVSTANSKWVLPFECIPITIWNDSTSAITTLTIYGTTTGGGVPKDDEIWADVEYIKDAGDPLGGFTTSSKADNLAASAATNNTSDSSTWAGGGAGNGFKIVLPTFTPAQKGWLTIYVKVAKLSSTYYIDPKPSINAVTVTKSYIGAGAYTNEISTSPAAKFISAQRGTPY